MGKVSRRDFLKGSGAAALSIAAASLLGCSTTEKTQTTPETTQTPSAPTSDTLYTTSVNPQSEEYRTNTMELKTLFSPIKIGAIEINNRMVKSAAGSATYLAGLTDELFQYYVNLAKGGVELIYVYRNG